jgi:hypothetical protein
MSDDNESKPAPALGPDILAAIGWELRRTYSDIIAEGVPERFADVLHKLDELRKQHAQDRIEGLEPPLDWSEDDYAVVDEMLFGRAYRQPVKGDLKWLWFLQTVSCAITRVG